MAGQRASQTIDARIDQQRECRVPVVGHVHFDIGRADRRAPSVPRDVGQEQGGGVDFEDLLSSMFGGGVSGLIVQQSCRL